ncbi:hypothetical protein [Proteus faecis]|uniref:hypothetical protein n=1 Tax=Proteus faecis TaxID=2050967 RepID=UPI000D6993D6|nr:hypothetical protein [Proteus faecis]
MNKIISDSIRLTQIAYNDEVHFTNNESQLKTITSKNLQNFKIKLQLLSLISKKGNSAEKKNVGSKKEVAEVIDKKDVDSKKEVAEVVDKKEKLSTNKNTKDELETDGDELKNLEGLLLNQQIMQPVIPLNLKKQLISQGIDIKNNKLKNTINYIDKNSRKVDLKRELSTPDSNITNKKINIKQKDKEFVDSKVDKKESINKILKKSMVPHLSNTDFKYGLESKNKNEFIHFEEENHNFDRDLNKLSNSKNKLDNILIEGVPHHDLIKDENNKLPLNNKLGQDNDHVLLADNLREKTKNRLTEQLQGTTLINTAMSLSDIAKSQLTPKIENMFSGKQLLNLPTWNILHKTDVLFSKPNNITYVFKRWGNDNHQVQIRFALENQIQLIASTGRVYQASFENLNQYQGRSTLSLENNEKNSYRHINSIDADKHKEDEY